MNKTWWKEAVIYQIYPRSFMDSNGDGFGDLNGITSRLDYLKYPGIDVIWLSPVYKSPNDVKWWCDKGIDGFRMDVISMISKTKEMPDGEIRVLYGDYGPYSVNGSNVHNYLQEMNEKVLSKYDIMTVGETPGVTTELAKQYAGENTHELNMVFQFEHVDQVGKYGKWTDEKMPLTTLKNIMSRWQTALYGTAWNSLFLDNHDQPRAVSRFGDDRPEHRENAAKMLATCLHMMQGTPYIYRSCLSIPEHWKKKNCL